MYVMVCRANYPASGHTSLPVGAGHYVFGGVGPVQHGSHLNLFPAVFTKAKQAKTEVFHQSLIDKSRPCLSPALRWRAEPLVLGKQGDDKYLRVPRVASSIQPCHPDLSCSGRIVAVVPEGKQENSHPILIIIDSFRSLTGAYRKPRTSVVTPTVCPRLHCTI